MSEHDDRELKDGIGALRRHTDGGLDDAGAVYQRVDQELDGGRRPAWRALVTAGLVCGLLGASMALFVLYAPPRPAQLAQVPATPQHFAVR